MLLGEEDQLAIVAFENAAKTVLPPTPMSDEVYIKELTSADVC